MIPDILANGGGVVTSYLGMVQDSIHFSWTDREVASSPQERMVRTYKDVTKEALLRGMSLRQASYVLAVTRVVQAMKARGMVLGSIRDPGRLGWELIASFVA